MEALINRIENLIDSMEHIISTQDDEDAIKHNTGLLEGLNIALKEIEESRDDS